MLKYDANGLIPAVVQDASTRQVLMVGYMNAEALRRTGIWMRTADPKAVTAGLALLREECGHSDPCRRCFAGLKSCS